MFGESTHIAKNRGVLNEADHICFNGTERERYQDFDYSAVDHALGVSDEPDTYEAAAELASLLQWIWETPGNLPIARKRFKALSREVVSDPGETRTATAFEKVIRWCFSRHRGAFNAATPWRRFCALSATVDPRLVAAKTYTDLAKELRVTKSAVSANAREFRERFSFHYHEWRSDEGREHMHHARMTQRLPGSTKVIGRNCRN